MNGCMGERRVAVGNHLKVLRLSVGLLLFTMEEEEEEDDNCLGDCSSTLGGCEKIKIKRLKI